MTTEWRTQLAINGIILTNSVPDSAWVASAPDATDWESLGAHYVTRLEAADKISPLVLAAETAESFVVEFHPDADMSQARELVSERGLTVREHPDLLPTSLLVEGELWRVYRLAEWDEVAWIFPASGDLRAGEPVAACAGAALGEATAASFTKIGNGWQPVNGSVQLHYVITALTAKLPPDASQAQIERALQEWTKYARLTITPGGDPDAVRTIKIFFARGAHGDSYPFNGPGGVLAHTFYPAPPNPEPIAGDMHLDEDENWRIGENMDLFSVALHEAGHALGLGHSSLPGAVMYPYYRMTTGLAADDIAGIRDLYGAADAPAPTPTPDPTPTPTPTPDPTPTPTPTPVPAPTLSITSPAGDFTTAAATIAVQGVSSGPGIRVTWSTDRGTQGIASGSTTWSIGALPLSVGLNHLTVTVTDSTGRTASRAITVTRTSTQADPPVSGSDTVAPSMQIVYPGATIVGTSAVSITVRGIASDNVGVTAVQWSVSGWVSGPASGTTSWAASVPLRMGTNQVTVRAFDAAGNSSWRALTVVRR